MADARILFNAHRDAVFRYLSRIVGQADTADELTQEVFLRASRSPLAGETEIERRAWVVKVARNLALNHLRDERRRPQTVELTDAAQDEFTAYVQVTGTRRARARRDGLVDLDVDALRSAGLLLPSSPPGACGSSTRKSITVRLGDTPAIEIPQPSSGLVMTALRVGEKMPGSGSIGARPAGTGEQTILPKMSIRDGRFVFNTGAFLKDHVTRVLTRLKVPDADAEQAARQAVAPDRH